MVSKLHVSVSLLISLFRTSCTKQAWMECNMYGLSSLLEKMTTDHYKKGAEQVNA